MKTAKTYLFSILIASGIASHLWAAPSAPTLLLHHTFDDDADEILGWRSFGGYYGEANTLPVTARQAGGMAILSMDDPAPMHDDSGKPRRWYGLAHSVIPSTPIGTNDDLRVEVTVSSPEAIDYYVSVINGADEIFWRNELRLDQGGIPQTFTFLVSETSNGSRTPKPVMRTTDLRHMLLEIGLVDNAGPSQSLHIDEAKVWLVPAREVASPCP